MGDKADDILRSFGLSADDAKKYDVVKGKFDSHFIKRRNVIYERARFYQRRKEAGETVDCFVTALYGLAEHCEYAALHDEMIRDRIVVGLRDATWSVTIFVNDTPIDFEIDTGAEVSVISTKTYKEIGGSPSLTAPTKSLHAPSSKKMRESLQLDPELTLEKAVTKARQAEAVKQQQLLVRGSSETKSASGSQRHDTSLGEVTHKGRRGKPNSTKPDKDQSPKSSKTCGWCGKSPSHKKAQYPAKDTVCHKCKKEGHLKSVCRSVNKLHTSSDSESDSDTDMKTFVGVITRGDETPWSITIFVNDTPIDFEIDTGAEVSVISTKTYKEIGGSPSLTAPTKSLHGPSSKKLSVMANSQQLCDTEARS
jgi:predicted aspartyl protease